MPPAHLVPRPRTAQPRVSVVIPTYNEAANLPHVFESLPPVDEVILVDGHSTDGTVDVARGLRPDVKVVMQTRRGKGNALACGFAAATGEIIVMIDADGSTDPAEIPRFVQALLDGADYAKGSRFTAGGGSDDITPARRMGNKALNGLVNMLYGTEFTDLCYGYNAFWSYVLPVLGLSPGAEGDEMLWGDGFEIETIINTRVAKAGLRVAEVPSHEANRLHGASNLHAVRDGFRVLKAIRKERSQLSSRRSVPNPSSRCSVPSRSSTWTSRIDLNGVADAKVVKLRERVKYDVTATRVIELPTQQSSTSVSTPRSASPDPARRSVEETVGDAHPVARARDAMDGVSVVICSFTLQRWDDLQDAVRSVRRQTARAAGDRRRRGLQPCVAGADQGADARRRGGGQPVRPRRLRCAQLRRGRGQGQRRRVPRRRRRRRRALAGTARPGPRRRALRPRPRRRRLAWSPVGPDRRRAGSPPSSTGWSGGSYRGLPTERAEIRNVWTCNMAIRRDVFDAVGGFRQEFGKVGARARPEDTDLCLRTRVAFPGAVWMFEPAAVAEHKVPADRATLRYYLRRCYAEGVGKAELVALSDRDAMSDERRHAMRELPLGVARGLADTVTGRDAAGILRSAAIVAGLAVAAAGWVAGAVALRRAQRADRPGLRATAERADHARRRHGPQPAPATLVPPEPAENPDHASAA